MSGFVLTLPIPFGDARLRAFRGGGRAAGLPAGRVWMGAGLTDDELVARGADGDEEAFRVLVDRWEQPVFAFLNRMLGSAEEAQDLTQETFLRVVRGAGKYRASGQFRSWLFRIAGNQARSRLRRRKIVRWVSFDAGVHDVPHERHAEHDLEAADTRDAVRAALSRLPERQRRAVLLRQYQEMSYREIAEQLGTTVSAVESLLHRAMAALRDDLGRNR
jgi:RNA polymerase sigma-70 factor, ECF subfamily